MSNTPTLSPALLALIDHMTEKQRRLFACDCAEHVLHWFEHYFPNDQRPRTAIEVARRYANAEVSKEELHRAQADAESAAYDAGYKAWINGPDFPPEPEIDAAASAAATAEGAAWCGLVSTITEAQASREAAITAADTATVEIAAVGSELADLIWSRGEDAADNETVQRFRAARDQEERWQIECAKSYLASS